MRRNEPIHHIMTSNPHSVQLGQPLSAVRRLMFENGYHHVPVVDGKKLVGMIAGTDLLRVSFGADTHRLAELDAALDYTYKISDVMKASPVSLYADSTVRDAAEVLGHAKFHSLPVTGNDGELLGIVTSTDLIRYLHNQY
jgi:CBS domain-containing protein